MQIEIFSDPVCPWCLVGLTRLDNALNRLPSGTEINLVHRPFLLDANTPKEGEDVVAMLKRKYGVAPDEMWDRLEHEAKVSGLDLDMRKQKWRAPSQKALVLIMAAHQKGTQHALAKSISHACYMDGKNIADMEVLQELAGQHGFSAQEVEKLVTDEGGIAEIEKQAKWAAENGVNGVPLFLFNNSFSVSGAQREEVFDSALNKALSEVAAGA